MRRLTLPSILTLVFVAQPSFAQVEPKIRVAELSPRAEAAMERGYKHLVRTQAADGGWSQNNQVAVTSLCMMAFMVKGYFPDHEPYGEPMAKGLQFLLTKARGNNGYIGTNMYEHGLATLALSEVWGESSRSDEIRDALKNGVGVILRNQSARGGWGYYPDRGIDYEDVSITVMQIVALASAKEAGIGVPDETIKRAIQYVKSCQNPNGGFGYRNASDPKFARSAAGVTSLLMAGDRKSPEVERGLKYLHAYGGGAFNPGSAMYMQHHDWFYYGHFYAVQAMYQSSEKNYLSWYPRVRDALIDMQDADGGWRGGIPPRVLTKIATDRDSYCTPMSILILGVPYRYLPIYQR